MSIRLLHLLSVLLTAILTGGGLAHLLALPNKIDLPADEYLTVQHIYDGWALLGIPMLGALASAALLAFALRRRKRKAAALCAIAALLIGLSLAIFFAFTYPANRATQFWTALPADWERLRDRWEYSHAAAAVLDFAALTALVIAGQNLGPGRRGRNMGHD